MGQFDTVIINVNKLPISEDLKKRLSDKNNIANFQTKDLELAGYLFEITKNDYLIAEILDQNITFDKLNKIFRIYTTIGGFRFPKSEWPKQDYKWIEFIVTFEQGKLKSIIFDQDLYDNGKKW